MRTSFGKPEGATSRGLDSRFPAIMPSFSKTRQGIVLRFVIESEVVNHSLPEAEELLGWACRICVGTVYDGTQDISVRA